MQEKRPLSRQEKTVSVIQTILLKPENRFSAAHLLRLLTNALMRLIFCACLRSC
jgi:hypothetical protein